MLSMSSSADDERLQRLDGQVGHVAAGDDHVAHARASGAGSRGSARSRSAGFERELVLVDLRASVADQVHAGAVAAVLRAGGEQLGQHLRGVAVGQPLHRPTCPPRAGSRAWRAGGGPVGPPVARRGQHVPADRVGSATGPARVHGVEHLRRDQHRHRRPLALVPLEVGVERLVRAGRPRPRAAAGVLDAVGALPLRASHSSAVTSRQPGSRVQSGSTIPVRAYRYGWS